MGCFGDRRSVATHRTDCRTWSESGSESWCLGSSGVWGNVPGMNARTTMRVWCDYAIYWFGSVVIVDNFFWYQIIWVSKVGLQIYEVRKLINFSWFISAWDVKRSNCCLGSCNIDPARNALTLRVIYVLRLFRLSFVNMVEAAWIMDSWIPIFLVTTHNRIYR